MRLGFILLITSFSIASTTNAQFVNATKVGSDQIMQSEWVTQVLPSPDGTQIVTGGIDGRVVFWSVADGKELRSMNLTKPVLAIALSKDGLIVAAGDATGKVSLIDFQTAKVSGVFTADKNITNAVAFTDDGKFVAGGGSEGIVRIATTSDTKSVSEINPGHGDITALAFTKNQLAVGLRDNKDRKRSAEIWDWQNNKLVRTIDEGPAGLRAISVTTDGKLLAIADYKPATLLTMTPTEGSGAEVSLRVLADDDDGTAVAIWDVATGKRVALINGETGARSVAFSPDGRILAIAGSNGVIFHDIGAGTFAEIGRINSQTNIDAVSFFSDSNKLILARAREPLVKYGGTEKLVDPFFTSLIMQVREGLNTGVMMSLGASVRESPTRKDASSVTGGSTVEAWQITRKTLPPDQRTWEAVQRVFDDKPDEARKILERVIKDFPSYGEAQRLNAILFENKDLNKVQDLIKKAVKADPSCLSCLRSLGDIQHKQRLYHEAIQSYEMALQRDPAYGLVAGHKADSYGGLGLSLLAAGNDTKSLTAAIAALSNAIKLRPGVEQHYTNLGAAAYFAGDHDTNIGLLLIAKRLRPDHARIYYNLGHSYREKGDKANAISAYRRYVSLGEKGEEARVERAKIYIAELSK